MSVAVKVLARGEITPQQRSDIVNEVAALQSLMHPNLIRVLGLTEQPARHLSIVTEWLHGGSLAEFLRRNPSANEHQRLDIFINVCSAGTASHFRPYDRGWVLVASFQPRNCPFTSHQSIAFTPTPAALQATG